MTASLKLDEGAGLLYVTLAGSSFQDDLGRVKGIPGRRYNGAEKRWELPADPETALRVMSSLQPHADAAVQALVSEAKEQIATQLLTNVGEDCLDLQVPWADALFPYQRSGVSFLVDHPNSLLADEMGLGKTIEAISAVHEKRLRDGTESPDPLLTICPRSVRGVWTRELEVGPVDRDRKPIIAEWQGLDPRPIDGRTPRKRLAQLEEDADAYVINWEAFWREPIFDALREREFEAIIADEAHRAKNRKSKQSKGLRKLDAAFKMALTGTPVMNSPDELWALLTWLRPKEYTSFWAFHNMYVDEYIAGSKQRVMVGVKNADALRFELSDKLVRRRKVAVLKDLPEKMDPQIIEVELSPAERRLYNEVDQALILDIAAHIQREADEYVAACDANDLTSDRIAFIQEQTEALAAMPLDRLTGLVDNAGARIAKLRQITAAAKVVVANELIREEPDTPVVAFTWHVDAAHQLAAALSKGQPPLRVGTIAGTDDPDPVEAAFQAGDLDHVVCTIAKGGTGLTLTRSSDPLMIEEDWVPPINDQAIDRTHRIGQTKPVTPRILRCPGTVDTGRIAPKIEFKRTIIASVYGE